MDAGRRVFMATVAKAAGLALMPLAGCARPPTREQVLRSLIERVMVPEHAQLVKTSRELADKAKQLSNIEQLSELRTAFGASLLTWMRVYSFREGPVITSYALMRALYWPTRAQAVAELNARVEVVDAKQVELLGVDRRGMFAIEQLLFAPDCVERLGLEGETGVHARALLAAFAENVARYAELATAQLGDGAGLVGSYAAAGQESVAKLVNQLIGSVEAIVLERFSVVAKMAASGGVRRAEIRGGQSGLSTQIASAELSTIERLYVGVAGLGLSALVKPVAAELDVSLRGHLHAARSGLAGLRQPIELAVEREPEAFERAFAAVRTLERALKTELASALGVTLMFVAGDGD